jgi:electron transfer flavoprotein beta subunit
MEIVVLVKPVPEAETRLRPNAAGTALETEGVKFVLGGYDESAVEQALLLKEAVPGSTVRAVSFGPSPRAEEVLRASIALGCDAAVWVERPLELASDALLTARALAVALAKFPHALVLAGKQAGDDEQGVVLGAVAELAGLPSFGGVTNLRWDAARNLFTFDRAIEGATERYECATPLAIGLQQAWNDPRTAKLPNILKSRKAAIDRVAWGDVATALGSQAGARSEAKRFQLPAPRTGAKMLAYKTPQEAAQQLVRLLKEEAKVFP